MNSRPLTALSSDPNDLEVLTPGHFLIGRSLQSVPYIDTLDVPTNRLTYFQKLEQLKQQFWKRWSREYLSQLQVRSKWQTDSFKVKTDALVLVIDENLPPYKWRIGRVTKVNPGKDERVWVVSVRTSNGEIKRSVAKICVLPISQ